MKEKEINLYEIKTRNKQYKLQYKPKMTLASCQIYEEAWTLGFNIKLATVILHDDWNYEIKIEDFSREKVCIDKPKKYDRAGLVD